MGKAVKTACSVGNCGCHPERKKRFIAQQMPEPLSGMVTGCVSLRRDKWAHAGFRSTEPDPGLKGAHPWQLPAAHLSLPPPHHPWIGSQQLSNRGLWGSHLHAADT